MFKLIMLVQILSTGTVLQMPIAGSVDGMKACQDRARQYEQVIEKIAKARFHNAKRNVDYVILHLCTEHI